MCVCIFVNAGVCLVVLVGTCFPLGTAVTGPACMFMFSFRAAVAALAVFLVCGLSALGLRYTAQPGTS